MESKKRKREESVSAPPLITYHAPGRTFERLFNEKTLEDTKRVVRGKLGLDNNAHITLEQIREGRTIDLEDDDDFAALRVLARSVPAVEVRVTVTPVSVNPPPDDLAKVSARTKKRKRAQTPGPTPTPVELPKHNIARAQSQPLIDEPSKTRKLLDSLMKSGGITPLIPAPKKRKPNSVETQPQSAEPTSVVDDEGKEKRKEKEQSVAEPPSPKKRVLRKKNGASVSDPPASDFHIPPDISQSNHSKPDNAEKKATKSNPKVVASEPVASTSSLPVPAHEELHKKKRPARKGDANPEKSGKVKKASGSKGKDEDAVESVNVPAIGDPQQSSVQKKTTNKLPTIPPSAEATPAEPQPPSAKKTQKGVPLPTKGTLNSLIEPDVHEDNAGRRKKRQKKTIPEDVETVTTAPAASEESAVTKKSKSQKTEKSKASPEMLAAAQAHLEAFMTSKLGSSSTVTEPRKDGDREEEAGTKSKRRSTISSRKKKDVAEPKAGPISKLPQIIKRVPTTSPPKPTLSPSPIDEAPPPLASQHAFGSDEYPCPICLEGPFHLRYECPTVTAGPEVLEKRIKELREGAGRGEGAAMQWQNLPGELDIILKQMKARIGVSRSAAMPESIRSSTTTKLIIPSGSTVSEVTVENKDEGSSNEGSDDDDDDEENGDDGDDEEAQPSRRAKSSSPYKIPPAFSGQADLENLDIEALIRGPASQSKSVLDDIPSRSDSENKDDEDDAEEVEEEVEENDKEYRRQAKRLEKWAASSDENDDDIELPTGEDGNVEAGGAIAPREISPELGNSAIAHEDALQQAVDGSVGSLAEDSEKTKVAPSEENSHNSDTSMFDCDPSKAKRREAFLTTALDFLDSNPLLQDESRSVPGDPTLLSKTTEDIMVNDAPSERTREKIASDPIESAGEFDKDQTPPRQTSARAASQSPRKPGTAKRMKTRSGKLPSYDTNAPLPVSNFLPTSTPLPDMNAAVQPSTAHGASSVDVMPPPLVPETNTPARRGRRHGTNEETAAREKAKADEKARKAAAAKQAEKEEKAKQRAAALAKKSANKPSGKTPSDTPSTLQHTESTSSEKASQLPQPVTKLANIDGISPKSNDTTSQLVDELHSSPRSGSAKVASQGPADGRAPVYPGSKPLFLPSDSQSHFPYSQFQIDTTPAQPPKDDSSIESDSPSEVNTTLQPKPIHRLTSSAAPKYRRLTDIASQEIFLPSAMTPLNYLSPTPAVGDKSKINKNDDDDSSSSQDDSASDSNTDVKSHIPKSRRVRFLHSRKKGGLFSYA